MIYPKYIACIYHSMVYLFQYDPSCKVECRDDDTKCDQVGEDISINNGHIDEVDLLRGKTSDSYCLTTTQS